MVMFRTYSWFCAQESFLARLQRSYGLLGIEPHSSVCKASIIPFCTISPDSSRYIVKGQDCLALQMEEPVFNSQHHVQTLPTPS